MRLFHFISLKLRTLTRWPSMESKVQGCPGVEPELRGSMDAELGESDPHF